MRVNGMRCDACCKEHLFAPDFVLISPVQHAPKDWFVIWKSQSKQEEPWLFCSVKCLSDWAEKQLIAASPKEVVPPPEENTRWENW